VFGFNPKNEKLEGTQHGAPESGVNRREPQNSGEFAVEDRVSGTQEAVKLVLDEESAQGVVERIKKGAVVWIVDDEVALANGLKRNMMGPKLGFKNVEAFSSPADVIDRIYKKGEDRQPGKILMIPGFILTDTNMPGMEGNAMIAKLEEIFDRHNIPKEKRPVYFAMSGLSMDIGNAGAMGYYTSHEIRFFPKPLEIEDVVQLIIEDLTPRFTKKSKVEGGNEEGS
jgi:CheY-like chemotaxis protein